jgi:hypothetical protein
MQNMFKDKENQITKSKLTIEIKVIISLVNMVDVNVTTKNKGSEKQICSKLGSERKGGEVYGGNHTTYVGN